jgi:hypothetical protein
MRPNGEMTPSMSARGKSGGIWVGRVGHGIDGNLASRISLPVGR